MTNTCSSVTVTVRSDGRFPEVELADLRPLGTFENHYEYKNDTVHAYYATTSAEKIIPHRGEIIAYGWFAKDDLPKEISITAQETLKLLS